MSDAMRIEKEKTGTGGRYVAHIDGVDGEAQLVFTDRVPGLISADHTEAPESMRGSRAALAPVEHMIAATGFKIMPLCPYVLAQLRKHRDWGDVMSGHRSSP